MMNWDAIGALGELIGGVLVLGTLVYLAVQVKANTRGTQLTLIGTLLGEINAANRTLATDVEVSRIFRLGMMEPQTLTDDELMQFQLLLGQFINIHYAIWTLHKANNMDEQFVHWSRGGISVYRDTPGWQQITQEARHYAEPGFYEYIDSIPAVEPPAFGKEANT